MAGLVEVVDREEPSTVRFGEDVLLRRRWCRPNTSPTARVGSGTPIVQAEVTQITYTLCRLKNGTWTIVEDHNAVVLTITDVIFDALQPWGSDNIGFNFQHIVEETSLAPIAEYRAIYDVTLGDGFSKQFTKDFAVVHEFDAGEVPGESTVFLTGSPGADGQDGAGYLATSTSSVAIGTGSKTFTTQSGLAYTVGARVRVSSEGDTSNWMEGLVTAYSGVTLALNVTLTNGSGTHADWNINLAGERGATGGTGSTGATGDDGPGYTATSTSSHTIGTGSKVFVTQTGLAYTVGARVRISLTSDTSNWMEGLVTAYAFGSLTVAVDLTNGSGSGTSWNINLAGEPGEDGSGINLLGEWDSGTSYVVGDVVSYLGSSYAATVPSANSEPTDVNPNWQLLAAKGDDGDDGADFIYNVKRAPYSAVGDGSTDDTAAIQAALTAAASYSGGTAVVYLPEGTYKVGTSTTAGSYAVTLSGSDLKLRGPGMLKLAAASGADAVLNVSGNRNQIDDITVDGNAAGSPTGRGDCFYITGNDNIATKVRCQNSKTTTGIDFLIIGDANTVELRTNGLRNKWINCISRNAGYNAFDNRGDFTTLRDCEAHDFGTHGYNHAGYATSQVTIDGLLLTAASGTALTGLIMDPGSGQTDAYVKHATIRNVRMGTLGSGTPTLSLMKISRVHNLLLDGIFIDHTTNFSTIKLVEAIKSVTFRDCFFARNIDFDELSPASGSITSCADDGSGFTKFTSASHGLTKRDIIYIPDSSVSGYNGVHEVTAADTNTFTTDCAYSATATGTFYDCQGSVTLERVQIGQPGTTFAIVGPLSGLRTPNLTLRNCWFYGCSTRAIALKQTYPITAVEKIDVEGCYFEHSRAVADAYVLGAEDGSNYLTTSRKIRWKNNSYRNVKPFAMALTKSADADILLSSLDGGRDFILSSGTLPSGTAVTWQVGDRFWKPSPTSGKSPGWICTTAGTFNAGTFKPMAPVSDGALAANTSEAGNSSTGETNLISYTMPANTLDNDGDTVEVEAGFSFAANGNNKTVKLYIGSDVVYDSGAVAQNGGSLLVRATLVRDTGVIAKVSSLAVPSASSSFATKSTYFQTATAFASSNVIKGTGTATSDNDVVMEYLRVQKRPAP